MKTKELVARLGELGVDMISTPFECSFYGYDVTPLPKETNWVFKGTTPQVIMRPKSAEEVASIMIFANKNKVPVTPRGGGTSGYFQSVPRRHGIVLETLALNQIGQVKSDASTVQVGAGAIWCKIDWELKKQGYTLKTYPTSYRSSTVAGWMQTEGLGVGSIAFGSIRKLIRSIEVVLPSGEPIKLKRGEFLQTENGQVKFEDYFKSEGMLGVITSVELEVRKLPQATSSHLFGFKDYEHFAKHAKALADVPSLYFVEFVNGAYMDLLQKSAFHSPAHTDDTVTAVIRLEGDKETVEKGVATLKGMLQDDPQIKEYPHEEAEEEYGERLRYFRIKNAYTSVTPADISVPTANLAPYIKKVFGLRFRIALKGELLTPETTGIMFFYVLANELSLVRFLSAAPYQMEIILSAMKFGGAPNGGVGFLNTPYVYGLRTDKERKDFAQKKEMLDPNWVMNPGKWLDPLFILRPSIYFTAMKALEPVCFLLGAVKGRW